jgi:hypothetical protein
MTNFLEAFGAQIVYYSDLVLFKQKFKLKNNSKQMLLLKSPIKLVMTEFVWLPIL